MSANVADRVMGYEVHPALALFPLLEGDEFDELVESIRTKGLIHPIVLKGSVIVDGRNRLLAIEHLRRFGVKIPIRTVQFQDDRCGVVRWIYETNFTRQHLTPDAQAIVSADAVPMLAAEKRSRKGNLSTAD